MYNPDSSPIAKVIGEGFGFLFLRIKY